MTGQELKNKFIEFFISKGHTRIPNSSLIPENDPSALFINSGMHPIVPFLLGEPHPLGTRLTNYQRAVRTGDIESVGVKLRHLTYFNMLGEWSLGDYGKRESLGWTMEFMFDVIGFDPRRVHATVFEGDDQVPQDTEAIEILKELYKKYGIEADVDSGFKDEGPSSRIVLLGAEDNFWKVGAVGPCGPTVEFYYDRGPGLDADARYFEVVNNVFMFYYMDSEGKLEELKQKNIDVGWGWERLLTMIDHMLPNGDIPGEAAVYDIKLFDKPKQFILDSFHKTPEDYKNEKALTKAVRIVLDHIRASVMIIADGVEPSNKDQGYVLRRIIRRAVSFGKKYSQNNDYLLELAKIFIEIEGADPEYVHVLEKREFILNVLKNEINKFDAVLKNGVKELQKINSEIISGETAFRLKESLGLPLEITLEIAEQSGKKVDVETYEKLMDEHQERSRTAAAGKFVGGLGDHSPESIRLHTCAHLFLAGAQKILGEGVHQKGQNITPERLRYDISYATSIDKEQLQQIEDWVNSQIDKGLIVDFVEMTIDEANDMGAEGVFGDKYAKLDKVKVYRMYEESNKPKVISQKTNRDDYISLELCGGPHVSNTKEIKEHGRFRIVKEESSSQGVRRIKAIIE